MKIILKKIKISESLRNEKSIGFVPTMGGIHLGHISLIKRSVKECKKTIVSIFVNKQQFNRLSDYNEYPRVLNKDIKKIKRLGVDILYLPLSREIYPRGYNKSIKINHFSKKLCGKFRPRHFEGVADVIDRFLKIINPSKIYLGEKDMQQLLILKDFLRGKFKCKVVSCKTVREKNGIPYSSRNVLLKKKEKMLASKFIKIVKKNKIKLIKKKIKFSKIKNTISSIDNIKIDYIKAIDINKIIKPFNNKKNYRVFIAFFVGKTRLIDNI